VQLWLSNFQIPQVVAVELRTQRIRNLAHFSSATGTNHCWGSSFTSLIKPISLWQHHKDGVRGLTMFALLLMLAGVTAGCVYAVRGCQHLFSRSDGFD
jgi:hypothetical protein